MRWLYNLVWGWSALRQESWSQMENVPGLCKLRPQSQEGLDFEALKSSGQPRCRLSPTRSFADHIEYTLRSACVVSLEVDVSKVFNKSTTWINYNTSKYSSGRLGTVCNVKYSSGQLGLSACKSSALFTSVDSRTEQCLKRPVPGLSYMHYMDHTFCSTQMRAKVFILSCLSTHTDIWSALINGHDALWSCQVGRGLYSVLKSKYCILI